MVSASEIGSQIAAMIKGVVSTIIEIANPIATVLGVAMIVIGLLAAVAFRQEFWGIRLVTGGIITLVFIHLVLPLLLSFV